MTKLELFYFPQCPFCHRVLIVIDDLGIKNKIEFLNINENQDAANRLRNDTGRTTVPCLYIDNSPMFESSDIVKLLTEKFSS